MNKLKLSASNIEISQAQNSHLNKLRFKATVMYIDKPSDGIPSGDPTDRIIISKEEAVKAVDSLNLMGINCDWDSYWNDHEDVMTGHDPRNKIGVVEKAYIEENEIKIDGIIYQHDFPDIAYFVKNTVDSLGFSVECAYNPVEKEDEYTYLEDVEFLGVAMLFKNLAAYKDTYIETLSAKGKYKTMTPEEMKQFEDSVVNRLAEVLSAKAEEEKAAQAEKAKVEAEMAKDKEIEELKAQIEELKKATEKVEPVEEIKEEVKAESKEVEEAVTADLATKAKLEANEKPVSHVGGISAFYADFLKSL